MGNQYVNIGRESFPLFPDHISRAIEWIPAEGVPRRPVEVDPFDLEPQKGYGISGPPPDLDSGVLQISSVRNERKASRHSGCILKLVFLFPKSTVAYSILIPPLSEILAGVPTKLVVATDEELVRVIERSWKVEFILQGKPRTYRSTG